MATSLPSKRIANVDAVEVENFDADFVYNFFSRDEKINDSGTTPPDFIENKPAADFDKKFIDSINFNRFTPRFVKFSWRPRASGNRPDLISKISVAKNISKIHNEQTFVTDDYTNVVFQDNQSDDKLAFFVRRAIEEAREDQHSLFPESPLDLSKYLHKNTSDDVHGDFLAEIFTRFKANGIRFLNKTGQKRAARSALSSLNKVKIKSQINNKILETVLKTTSQNIINVFDDETKKIIPKARQIQQKARSEESSAIISGKDYDFEIYDIVDYRVIDPNSFDSTLQTVGYVIDKVEFTKNGPIQKAPIIVESPYASTTVDLKVKYGSSYGYTIRSIVLIEIAVEDSDTNSVLAISFLVSSQNSDQIIVNCVEDVPPPTVTDFNIEWDWDQEAPRLRWSFPPNSQRDIKYFQIFRRKTIDEPFQLIKMFDFNNSIIKTQLKEKPDTSLVEKVKSPVNYFLDYEFIRGESKYIYSICSLDAHGFSSNYGIQFECTFDRFKNILVKKLISLAGAPKSYPNFFLQKDTFVDSIRNSSAESIDIIFNPEYLKVVDRMGNDLKLLKTEKESSVYKLQLINIDLQQEQTVDIRLLDKRPNAKKKK